LKLNIEKTKINDFYFKHKIKTRFRDLDAFKHVNNATFLSYLEDARLLFFKRWNINFKEKSLIVASAKIDYISQVSHPSELTICQKINRIGNKSFDNYSVIFCQQKIVCAAIITIVCYDFILKKTIPVYTEIKNDFNL